MDLNMHKVEGSGFVPVLSSFDAAENNVEEIPIYKVVFEENKIERTELYESYGAILKIYENGEETGIRMPERRLYFAINQVASEVAIKSTLFSDLYLVLNSVPSEDKVVIAAHYRPLVSFIWIGSIILVLGTCFAFLPARFSGRKDEEEGVE